MIGLFLNLSVLERADRAVAIHPLGIVKERVVVPVRFFARLECLFKLIGDTRAGGVMTAGVPHGHRQQKIHV